MDGRFALIVANGTYRDAKLSRLRSPTNDAVALARVLSDPDIGGFAVDLVEDEPEYVLRRRIAAFFAERSRDDLLLLHLSCHGLKDDSGQLYFAAADTEVEQLEATAVSAEFLSRQMTRSRSRKVVALLDCCYSGAIARGLRFRGSPDIDVEGHLGGHGRVVITASSAMEYAFEGDELSGDGNTSVFTTAVVKALETGEADRDQDHLISVDELYDYVCEQLREVTPSQRPNMLSHLEGELYVARSSYVVPVDPAELPLELRDAMHSRLAGVRGGAVDELATLLDHADPAVVVAARAGLEALAEDDSRRVAGAAAAALGQAAPAPAAVPVPAPAATPAPLPAPEPAPASRARDRGRGRIVTAAVAGAGALAIIAGSRADTSLSWLGFAQPAMLVAGLAGLALAIRLGAVRRPEAARSAEMMLLLAGGFAAGAAKAASTFQKSYGHGIVTVAVLAGAATLLFAGFRGARQWTAVPGPRRWAHVTLVVGSLAFAAGLLLPWTSGQPPGQLLGISLEATLWGGAIVALACGIAELRPDLRAWLPVPPAAVAAVAGAALLGVLAVAFSLGRSRESAADGGFWVAAIAAFAIAAAGAFSVSAPGASRDARGGSG